MSIKGSLKEYSFLDVLSILSSRRESGQLNIDYNCGQGSFDFVNGELAAAYFGALTGFSAVNVALQMEGTHFRFFPDAGIVATHFSDKNERLLLNRLLGTLPATSFVEPSMEDSQPAQPNLRAAQRKPEPDQILNNRDLQFESVPMFVTPSLLHTERRVRALWVVSVLLICVLAVAAVAAFGIRPKQRAVSQTSRQPTAEVTSEKSEASSRSTDKRSALADDTAPSTQYVTGTAGHKSSSSVVKRASFPSKSDSPRTNKAESGVSVEATGESSATPQRSFKEIPVVIKVEEGHVVEAYVRDRESGMGAFESTAIRLARQRHYPKDQFGTQTVVIRVESKQQGVANQ
jgi:cytoskeletal protein RodZ